MDTGHIRDRDRSRLPNYPRPPSRSSTSTSSTRMTPQSTNSSSSRLVSSPPPRPSTVVYPAHRNHHPRSQTPSTPRPQSVAPAGPSASDDAGSQSAASSFLQEKLQKRRGEAERKAAARQAQEVNSTMELHPRTAQSSPTKGSSVDGRRPQSSGGSERSEPAKKKGMGVKEMEATVSTLHKLNFDLKLELYHRRERQNALEGRVDSLESSQKETEEVNDQLLEELEKRDKAVQEAVQMIVLLEAQVEQLVKEREMVRQVEATGYSGFGGRDLPDASPNALSPRIRMADLAKLEDDARVVNRMPSFLSEKTESTANLRKVYLGTQGSLMSLPKLAEGPANPEHGRSTSMALRSPSLSELSESSFTSVYGDKEATEHAAQSRDGEPWTADVVTLGDRQRTQSNGSEFGKRQRSGSGTAMRGPRSSSISRPRGAGFQSIGSVVDQNSPTQRLEQSYSSHGEAPGSDAAWRGNRSPPQAQAQAQPQMKKTTDEKREALRRVTTDGNGRPHFDQALPPTPDTISTSTLRRFKNSNDTLVQQPAMTGDRGFQDKPEPVAEHTGGVPVSQPPSAPVTSRNEFVGRSYFDSRAPIAPRPRSADETTVSHKRADAGGAGAWGDSDDNGNDNASVHSLESSLDIWLQQGKEPKRRSTIGGRGSPDLFGFPSRTGAWESNAMFRQGASLAAEGASLHWPDPLQDLLPIQQELFGGTGAAPPPPNRRSSLHARTGSSSAREATASTPTAAPTVTATATPPRHAPEPSAGRFRRAFSRASRRNSEGGHAGRLSLTNTPGPPELQQTQQQQNKQNQQHVDPKQAGNRSPYPPPTRPGSTTPRTHRRINSLWRRSAGGGAGSVTSSPVAAKDPNGASTEHNPADHNYQTDGAAAGPNANGAPVKPANNNSGGTVGNPSWVHRARVEGPVDGEDGRSLGATPPPILRQPQLRQRGSGGGGGARGGGGGYVDGEGAPVGDAYDYEYVHVNNEREHGATTQESGGGTPATSTAVVGDSAVQGGGASLGGGAGASTGAGGMRKWLPGFGRTSSLRNRTG